MFVCMHVFMHTHSQVFTDICNLVRMHAHGIMYVARHALVDAGIFPSKYYVYM